MDELRQVLRKFLRPRGVLLSVLFWIGVDAARRFEEIEGEISGDHVLDIGSGGASFFSLRRNNCVSLDPRRVSGVDIRATATSLPFDSNSFDSVVCADTIEHIPRSARDGAFDEMKRVARIKVVIHAPLEDGKSYLGRTCDLALLEWYRVRGVKPDKSTKEHVANIEPSPTELEVQGFHLKGTHNSNLWLSYTKLYLGFRWPVGLILSQVYYALNAKRDKQPPFWGAVGVLEKTSGSKANREY